MSMDAKTLAKLLKEARTIMKAHPEFRGQHRDFLQRSAEALKKFEDSKQ